MIRILHFSDVHLMYPPGAWRHVDMLHPKRLLACANYLLRRRRKYLHADDCIRALHAHLDRHPADYILYTGDSTNAGLESEHLAAAPVLRNLLTRAGKGYLAVPGNHDLYTPASIGFYQRHWRFTDTTDLPEVRTPTGFPLVRFMGDEAAAIAIGSAAPHLAFWDSSGAIPPEELHALQNLLTHPAIQTRRHLFLMLHYPPFDKEYFHGLKNADALMAVLAERPDLIVLHGHNHTRALTLFGPAHQRAYCAGSLTSRGKEGFWRYELDGPLLNATPFRYTSAAFYPEPAPTPILHP